MPRAIATGARHYSNIVGCIPKPSGLPVSMYLLTQILDPAGRLIPTCHNCRGPLRLGQGIPLFRSQPLKGASSVAHWQIAFAAYRNGLRRDVILSADRTVVSVP